MHPSSFTILLVEAGNFNNFEEGLGGRMTSAPPQFGHIPFSLFSEQSEQNVHSNEQIRALSRSAGRSLLQHSQLGRISSKIFLLRRSGHLCLVKRLYFESSLCKCNTTEIEDPASTSVILRTEALIGSK